MKKIMLILVAVFFASITFGMYQLLEYILKQNSNLNRINYCLANESKECYSSMFELLLPKLLIHNIVKKKEKITYAKLILEPIWHPFFNLKSSRAFLYYTDNKNNISLYNLGKYADAAYGCFGMKIYGYYKDNNKLIPIPLPYDTYYEKKGYVQDGIFEVLNMLKVENQRVILHFDIEDFDNVILDKLFTEYGDVISGINLYLHISDQNKIIKSLTLLEKINKNFILFSRNSSYEMPRLITFNDRFIKGKPYDIMSIKTKYYKGDIYNSTFILSYINKNTVDKYSVSFEQNPEKIFAGAKVLFFKTLIKSPLSNIHWVVTFTESVKSAFIVPFKWNKIDN